MGDVKKTVQNLVLLEIDEANNILLIQGSVPGARNGFLVLRNAKKKAGMKVKFKGQAETEVKSKNPMKASKAGAGSAKPAAKGAKK
jgi:large subunit ribosomal protein L3